ncbi:hypothetical protein TrVE_jg11494 [Triparma verrucosa]|uniref:Major facilitator superfamily (MFS) profile domain-containing protein n=1 Tax=Triparma verrucosa TaxID=1606542 RepID=A0A9W7C4D1_9STRA|nr:hypothetical protein TrVE_jg11494 [Triparma verrucosa]
MPFLKPSTSALLGGVLCHLCYGTLYCWGNSTIYITSYFRQFDSELTTKDTLQVYAAALLGQALMMGVGGALENKIGARPASFLAIAGIAASSFISAQCTTALQLLFAQLLFGVAMGVGYLPPMSLGYKHLPKRKGFVSGLIVGGFGAGSFIFNFVVTGIVNPEGKEVNDGGPDDGYYTDEAILDRVPTMYRVLGVCYLVIGLTGAFCQVEPSGKGCGGGSEEESLLAVADGDAASGDKAEKAKAGGEEKDELTGKTTSEMIHDPLSFVLMSSLFCTAVGGMYMSATYKSFGEEYLKSDVFFATVGSAGAVFNGGCRVLWGMLADRIGVFEAMMVNASVFPVLFFVYNFAVKYEWSTMIIVCLMFGVYGGNYALYPAATAKLYGPLHAGSNYGNIFTLYGCLTAFIMYILGTTTIEYLSINYLILGCNLVGTGLVFFLRRAYRRRVLAEAGGGWDGSNQTF